MSEEYTPPGPAGPWPVLDAKARRVLGVLVEKAKTTPDAYPLTLNALVTGCNQKSNRDPIMELDEADVEETLRGLKSQAIVVKVFGGRSERWRHLLYETWNVDKLELAILAELLLRGPQSEGDLRGRANRMEPFEDLDILRSRLRPLVERNLVVYLTPEDRRGATLTHGFHDPAELRRLKAHAASAPASVAPAPAPVQAPPPRQDDRVGELVAAVAALTQRTATLEQTVAGLSARLGATEKELAALKQALGV
jgi:uncharacterized protein YceH (UPF0502 family)